MLFCDINILIISKIIIHVPPVNFIFVIMKRLLSLIIPAIIITSCSGFTKVQAPISPINMGDRDMETERFVQYTLTKNYFLGIGGMSAKARNTNVIHELMRKANLQTNEALAYISVSRKFNTFLGIFSSEETTASGYVVRPVEGDYAPQPQERFTPEEIQKTYMLYDKRISEARTGAELKEIEVEIDQDFQNGKLTQKEVTKLKRKISNSFF